MKPVWSSRRNKKSAKKTMYHAQLAVFLVLCTMAVLPGSGYAQVQLADGTNSWSTESNGDNASLALGVNIPLGTELLVVCATDAASGRYPTQSNTSATIGANYLTYLDTSFYNSSGSENTALYYYANPPTGSQTVTVYWTGGNFRCKTMGAIALKNVDTSSPIITSKKDQAGGPNTKYLSFNASEAPWGSYIVSSLGSVAAGITTYVQGSVSRFSGNWTIPDFSKRLRSVVGAD